MGYINPTEATSLLSTSVNKFTARVRETKYLTSKMKSSTTITKTSSQDMLQIQMKTTMALSHIVQKI